ncbi:DNA helicase UvrD [Candidatus Woesearchaeota archaeon]|nr:DNA helicase UvrD [Candidatus Woesearchaeota archaeon]
MQIISDLHIHSKYSRACSKQLDIKNLKKYAKIKGINLLGTGDFTHPEWIDELKSNLEEDETGILKTKTGFPFLLSSEISLIYSQGGKGRKVHNVVFAKNFEIVAQITDVLKKRGRVDYDGRPIFGIPCPEFVELMKEVDDSVEIIPAHIWTPWFSMFGSNSGFDSVKECFQDQTKHIHALETGLSSDPEMNWRLSQLDKYSLVSFSDSHSFWPWRLGREATVFELDKLTYDNIINALKTKQGLKETIEVDPSYGKYHWDGHRNCNVVYSPKESIKINNICPRCRRPLTIGVDHRVEELADRALGFKPEGAVPYKKLIPLSDLISSVYNIGVATKKSWQIFYDLINKFDNEYNILLNVSREELAKVADEKLADVIIKNRNQEIKIKPGYDGVYGIPIIDENDRPKEQEKFEIKCRQTGLNDFLTG